MLKLFAGIAACAFIVAGSTAAIAADHYVSGYTKADGTYVAPHYQTNPNSTTSDNYSTRGNVNPYTGQLGTKPDTKPSYGSTYTAPSYGTYGSKPAPKANCAATYSC